MRCFDFHLSDGMKSKIPPIRWNNRLRPHY
uniref:Uncharacterized protein n=1 Tax=Siphoviridae sp. ctLmu1 TaxID=2826253 RepID=A0A8S5NG56_9CAUD|nr:MAG TPA: hypothetical protein [Siphoviridae sp. ctLmu1]DAY60798.1 MAG TPA: hypothetical protein [Caudoviricetes sp.]